MTGLDVSPRLIIVSIFNPRPRQGGDGPFAVLDWV